MMVQVHYQAFMSPAKFPLYFQVLLLHTHSKQFKEGENNFLVWLLVMFDFFFL